MNTRDPKLIALLFNECINRQDLDGLSSLMADNHAFIDRDGSVHQPKPAMVDGWREFFKQFPEYHNIFNRIESRENLVLILGHGHWSEKNPYDPVIWTSTIVHDLVHEWRIYDDTPENRKRLNLSDNENYMFC
jgi:predicted SnoaL-like aldol condensation-catalyzing enzyme